MASTGIQLIQTLEGITGNAIGSSFMGYPQAIPAWLRAMKENVLFMARNIEDSFVLDIFEDLTPTEETIGSGPVYLLGGLGTSIDTAACEIIIANDASITPPGDAITTLVNLYLPIATATTPQFLGFVFFPYQLFATECAIFGAKAADGTTTPGTAGELKAWTVRRDE
jgi:hypothetical protein